MEGEESPPNQSGTNRTPSALSGLLNVVFLRAKSLPVFSLHLFCLVLLFSPQKRWRGNEAASIVAVASLRSWAHSGSLDWKWYEGIEEKNRTAEKQKSEDGFKSFHIYVNIYSPFVVRQTITDLQNLDWVPTWALGRTALPETMEKRIQCLRQRGVFQLPPPNTEYIILGGVAMILCSEKCISRAEVEETERRWLERSPLSQRLFIFPGSSWEFIMEILFLYPFQLFCHFRHFHPSFYNNPLFAALSNSLYMISLYMSISLYIWLDLVQLLLIQHPIHREREREI